MRLTAGALDWRRRRGARLSAWRQWLRWRALCWWNESCRHSGTVHALRGAARRWRRAATARALQEAAQWVAVRRGCGRAAAVAAAWRMWAEWGARARARACARRRRRLEGGWALLAAEAQRRSMARAVAAVARGARERCVAASACARWAEGSSARARDAQRCHDAVAAAVWGRWLRRWRRSAQRQAVHRATAAAVAAALASAVRWRSARCFGRWSATRATALRDAQLAWLAAGGRR
eukprot:scaffold120975_cov66-Phaeocystis_antarctica.AAC.1